MHSGLKFIRIHSSGIAFHHTAFNRYTILACGIRAQLLSVKYNGSFLFSEFQIRNPIRLEDNDPFSNRPQTNRHYSAGIYILQASHRHARTHIHTARQRHLVPCSRFSEPCKGESQGSCAQCKPLHLIAQSKNPPNGLYSESARFSKFHEKKKKPLL